MTTAPSVSSDAEQLRWQGLVYAIVGAIFFSAKAIVAKLMYREGIDAISVIALRMMLSGPCFALIALWTWRQSPRLNRRDLAAVSVLGLLGYYASSMLDFAGLQYISAGLERLILFLTPSFVLLLNVMFFARRVGARQLGSLAMAYAGIVLVFWHDVHSGSQVVLGSVLVLIAAITYAIYLLLSGQMLARIGTLRLVALAMTVSSLVSVAQYVVLRPAASLLQQSATVWTLSLLNAVFCTVLPVSLTMMAVRRIGADQASQAGMIGPVSTLALGAWLLGEPVTLLQLGGAALVMGGIFLLSLRPKPA